MTHAVTISVWHTNVWNALGSL